jgi:hypothetical protein
VGSVRLVHVGLQSVFESRCVKSTLGLRRGRGTIGDWEGGGNKALQGSQAAGGRSGNFGAHPVQHAVVAWTLRGVVNLQLPTGPHLNPFLYPRLLPRAQILDVPEIDLGEVIASTEPTT